MIYVYRATIMKIVDGDTVDVQVDMGFDTFQNMCIRLFGINTPELRSKSIDERIKAQEAKKFVQDKIPVGSKIYIETFKDKKGKYGRYLANIYEDRPGVAETEILAGKWHSINQLLVENGHAKEYLI